MAKTRITSGFQRGPARCTGFFFYFIANTGIMLPLLGFHHLKLQIGYDAALHAHHQKADFSPPLNALSNSYDQGAKKETPPRGGGPLNPSYRLLLRLLHARTMITRAECSRFSSNGIQYYLF